GDSQARGLRTRLSEGSVESLSPARHGLKLLKSHQVTDVLYRALLAAVLDPTITIDAYGVIVIASDSVEQVFGWRPDELVGKNVKVLMPEPHHAAHDDYLANYRRTGTTHILGRTREFEVLHKMGYRF